MRILYRIALCVYAYQAHTHIALKDKKLKKAKKKADISIGLRAGLWLLRASDHFLAVRCSCGLVNNGLW